MMQNQRFSIENTNELTLNGFSLLRRLYMPIIGPKSTILYELLVDLSNDNYINNYYLKNICNHLQIKENQLEELFFSLEAVGLIDRYVKSDDSHLIIVINLPLSLEKFNKNSLLKKHLIKKIGIETYENIFHKCKKTTNNKVDYIDITKKYQDIFLLDFESHIDQQNNLYSTLDLTVNSYETHDENVKKLPSSHFIKYLLKRNVSFDENLMISHLLKLGFNDATINLFIDFCVNQNNKIVKNYIIKIAESFISRSLMSFNEVHNELSVILFNKKNKSNKQLQETIFNYQTINKTKSNKTESNKKNNLSIDEIFSDDEMKDMF